MKKLWKLIDNYKTYIIVGIGVLVNGSFAMDLIDEKTVMIIDTFLGFIGLGTIRHGIQKLGGSK